MKESISEILRVMSDTVSWKEPEGVATGCSQLDNLTRGVHRGSLTVLASQPSIGKSALALNIVHDFLERKPENPILYCSRSCHMELAFWWLSTFSDVPLSVYYDWDFRANEISRIAEKAAESENYPLYFAEYQGADKVFLDKITGWCAEKHPQLLVFDPVRWRDCAKLRRLARDLDLPVLALVDSGRKLIKTAAMESADAVIRLTRDPEEEPSAYGDEKIPVMLIVERNRFGLCGTCRMDYIPKTRRFRDADTFVIDGAYGPPVS